MIAGVFQGTASASNGSVTSADARDFNFEGSGILSATLSGSYVPRATLNGSVTYPGIGTTTFTSTYDADYQTTPSLATIAGTYTGSVPMSAGVQTASFTVSPGGLLSSTTNGCTVTGTVAPRSDGNAYNVSVTFGPAPCVFAGQTLSGIAYYRSATRTLYSITPNAARTDGLLFVGTKP